MLTQSVGSCRLRTKISRWHRPFVGHLSVRMRSDRYDLTGPKKSDQDLSDWIPAHRSYSRDAEGTVAIDTLFQNSRRLEYDYATRRNWHLGAGRRVTADRPPFLEISCHGSASCSFRIPITGKCGQSNDGGAESI